MKEKSTAEEFCKSHVAFMVDERAEPVPPLSTSLGKSVTAYDALAVGGSGLVQNDVLILRAF
jgi:hypothetical protein